METNRFIRTALGDKNTPRFARALTDNVNAQNDTQNDTKRNDSRRHAADKTDIRAGEDVRDNPPRRTRSTTTHMYIHALGSLISLQKLVEERTILEGLFFIFRYSHYLDRYESLAFFRECFFQCYRMCVEIIKQNNKNECGEYNAWKMYDNASEYLWKIRFSPYFDYSNT